MTVAELKEECVRVRKQGVNFLVLRVYRHGGQWMQIMKGLLGSVVGSDKHGSFVSVEIDKVEAKINSMDPTIDIPKVDYHRAKVQL